MEDKDRVTPVNPSAGTVRADPEKTVVAPRFDEKSIQNAQPAVPLPRRRRGLPWPLSIIVICLVASVAGGVIGAVVLSYYQGGGHSETSAITPPNPSGEASVRTEETAEATAPAAGTERGDAAETPEPATAARSEAVEEAVGGPADVPRGDAEASLRGALGEWIAATNARDIGRQMSFYGQQVNAFYRTRNVPREAVRAEKSRVFGSAEVIDVRAGEPEIRLSPDGQTAIMRFRKKYNIAGGGEDRRGEVLQELRWRRTGEGWKIVSERDLRVIQ